MGTQRLNQTVKSESGTKANNILNSLIKKKLKPKQKQLVKIYGEQMLNEAYVELSQRD
jgi:hypothetical protein